MTVRPAVASEIDHLASLWHTTWHESHAALMPAELIRRRTIESFRARLLAALADIRVVGPAGEPLGFCVIRGSELYQLFVSAEARGSGAAIALIDDAERRLAGRGVTTAHLGCAIGNERAARFYEKRGWRRVGSIIDDVDTSAGPFALKVWRYEKQLDDPAT